MTDEERKAMIVKGFLGATLDEVNLEEYRKIMKGYDDILNAKLDSIRLNPGKKEE